VRSSRGILLLLSALHILAAIGLVGWRNLLDGRAGLDFDLGMFVYRARVLAEAGFPGPVWDPGLLAGHRLGGTLSVNNRLGELSTALLRPLGVERAFMLGLALAMASVPLTLIVGLRRVCASAWTLVLAVTLGLLTFWSMRSGGHQHLSMGLYGWAMATAWLPLAYGWTLTARTPGGAAMAAGATWLVVLAEGFAVLALLPLGVAALARALRERTRVGVMPLVALAAAALALVPLYAPAIAEWRAIGGVDIGPWFRSGPSESLDRLLAPDRALGTVLLLAAAAALRPGAELPAPVRTFAAGSVALSAVGLGAFLVPGLAELQPARCLEPAQMLAIVPGAAFLARSAPRAPRAIALVLLPLVALPALGWAKSLSGLRPWRASPGPLVEAIVRRLGPPPPAGAAVLLEDAWSRRYGHSHLPQWAPLAFPGRWVIGGPLPATWSQYPDTTLLDGRFLGRPLDDWSDADLRECLERYRIGDAVVFSPAVVERLRAVGGVGREVGGGVHVLSFALPPADAVLTPQAGALAVRATTRQVWLPFHFDPDLVTEPPLRVVPVPGHCHRAPMIEVEAGDTRDFVLRLR
jgi:hypothetical protein